MIKKSGQNKTQQNALPNRDERRLCTQTNLNLKSLIQNERVLISLG